MTSKGPGLLQHARQPGEHRFTRYRSCPIYLRKNDPLSWVQVTPDTSEVVTPDTSEVDYDTMDVDAAERQYQRTTGIPKRLSSGLTTMGSTTSTGTQEERSVVMGAKLMTTQWTSTQRRKLLHRIPLKLLPAIE